MGQWINPNLLTWVVLPGLIFLARICDVTIGTIRIIFVSKGRKLWASFFGFFEVLIWLVAIGQIMQNLNNVFCYIAYAAGFASGNYIGITIEEKLAMGVLIVRIFTTNEGTKLIDSLRASGFGVTSVDAQGGSGRVKIVYTVIKRKCLTEVVEIIKEFNPKAFYSVEELRSVNAGVFPVKNGAHRLKLIDNLRSRLHR
ncbi:MAG: DUF2179 domain-containing protein [Bacteroidota bacterium]